MRNTCKTNSHVIHVEQCVVASKEAGAQDPKWNVSHALQFEVTATLPPNNVLITWHEVCVSIAQSDVDWLEKLFPLVVITYTLIKPSKWVRSTGHLLTKQGNKIDEVFFWHHNQTCPRINHSFLILNQDAVVTNRQWWKPQSPILYFDQVVPGKRCTVSKQLSIVATHMQDRLLVVCSHWWQFERE